MKKAPSLLYYLAFIPPEPLLAQVESLKQELSQRYQTYTALRSPAHITVQIPFSWNPEEEDKLIQSLKSFCEAHTPLKISLKDYGAFPPRVVFINPEPNEALSHFRKQLLSHMQEKLDVYHVRYAQEPYHPHMTLANRDWSPDQFQEAWQSLETAQFRATFEAQELSLLRHREGAWDVIRKIPLGKA